ncbi:MAG: MliC family protein [Thioalkalivibrionaceae bacterium]
MDRRADVLSCDKNLETLCRASRGPSRGIVVAGLAAVMLAACGGDAPESAPAPPRVAELSGDDQGVAADIEAVVDTAGAEVAEPIQPSSRVTFRCGDLLVEASFSANHVVLENGEGQRLLPQVVAASGARYADDEGHEFWNRGETALWTQAPMSSGRSSDALDCAVSEGERSPWAEGRERGLALRAVGQEPGWLLEVHGQGGDSLGRAVLLEQSGAMAVYEGVAWADDGGALSLDDGRYSLRFASADTVCVDSMSGERIERAVTLMTPAGELSGCARDYRDEGTPTERSGGQ